MSLMPELEGAARPAQDDDALSGSSYFSDEYTLPGDEVDDDARSIASASSYESYDSFCPREQLPSYRVPRAQGTSQPVYEAWVLCMSHETDHEVTKLTSCGIDILSSRDEERPFVVSRTEAHDQEELSNMTLASVNSYHAATKRGFAARLFRGKPKTYEQDLDERLRRLPMSLQSNLNGLLRNREEATSNRFRRRDWTVVMMREQYRYRFANAAPEQVKKKGVWKGKDPRRVEYLFVIKGAEGKVATDNKGMHQPREFGNPWKRVDEEERLWRESAKDTKRHAKGYLGGECYPPPPRRRSLSPVPNRRAPRTPPPVQDVRDPGRYRTVIIERERGRPSSRSRSRSRSRSPYSPISPSWSPMRNVNTTPHINPFVPLPVQHMGGLPPLPPTPSPYYAPTPGPSFAPTITGRFPPPPCVPAGHHHSSFGLPPSHYYVRPQPHGPPAPINPMPEPPLLWQPLGLSQTHMDEPLPQPDQFPIPVPMPMPMPIQQQHASPYPLEISSPPESPRAPFRCMGGGAHPMMPPPGLPTMEACHRLFDAKFPHDDDAADQEGNNEGGSISSSDRSSLLSSGDMLPPPPPPAPRPSNLTTPTEFSPASSQHTGSSVQSSTDGVTTSGALSLGDNSGARAALCSESVNRRVFS